MLRSGVITDDNMIINRELARKIGLKESIVVMQLVGDMLKNELLGQDYYGDCFWVRVTPGQMHEKLGCITANNIKNILMSLRNKGILRAEKFNYSNFDASLWYTVVDAEKLNLLLK